MTIAKKALEWQKLYENRFLLDDSVSQYYDVLYRSYKTEKEISRSLKKTISKEEFYKIPSYKWFCYLDWKVDWYYNLLSKKSFTQVTNNPILHEWIELLINRICWWNEEDMDYERFCDLLGQGMELKGYEDRIEIEDCNGKKAVIKCQPITARIKE